MLSIVCRFWLFFRYEFLLSAERSLFLVVFFSSSLLHVIFICIHNFFFNDIFFARSFFSIQFSLFRFYSFLQLFDIFVVLLFFCFIFFILSTVYILPYIKKNWARKLYITIFSILKMFKFVPGTSSSAFKLFHFVHFYFISNTRLSVILLEMLVEVSI